MRSSKPSRNAGLGAIAPVVTTLALSRSPDREDPGRATSDGPRLEISDQPVPTQATQAVCEEGPGLC